MPGYFGTETQRSLQAVAEAAVEFVRASPGACQPGRMMGCDDPDALGWHQIDAILARDGLCGFRMIPAAKVDGLVAQLAARQCRFDTWDVFTADAATALPVCRALAARPLPAGLGERPQPTKPEGEDTSALQSLMAACGVVPFSGSFLVGACGPAVTRAFGDATAPVAVGHSYLPHNRFSAVAGYAWGGLVAVAESHRGLGLGTFINARVVSGAFDELGATHVYELVSATNQASRRMVEACGLRRDPLFVCGIATASDATVFTR